MPTARGAFPVSPSTSRRLRFDIRAWLGAVPSCVSAISSGHAPPRNASIAVGPTGLLPGYSRPRGPADPFGLGGCGFLLFWSENVLHHTTPHGTGHARMSSRCGGARQTHRSAGKYISDSLVCANATPPSFGGAFGERNQPKRASVGPRWMASNTQKGPWTILTRRGLPVVSCTLPQPQDQSVPCAAKGRGDHAAPGSSRPTSRLRDKQECPYGGKGVVNDPGASDGQVAHVACAR